MAKQQGKAQGAKEGNAQSSAQQHVDNQQQAGKDATPLDSVRITNNQIARQFQYQKPDDEQVQQIQRIREAGGALAQIIKDNTPGSPDQTAAIRKVREAVMTANAAIVLRGK